MIEHKVKVIFGANVSLVSLYFMNFWWVSCVVLVEVWVLYLIGFEGLFEVIVGLFSYLIVPKILCAGNLG